MVGRRWVVVGVVGGSGGAEDDVYGCGSGGGGGGRNGICYPALCVCVWVGGSGRRGEDERLVVQMDVMDGRWGMTNWIWWRQNPATKMQDTN